MELCEYGTMTEVMILKLPSGEIEKIYRNKYVNEESEK
jgi:hypothetical protein